MKGPRRDRTGFRAGCIVTRPPGVSPAAATPGIDPLLAKVQATALAWVFQTITDQTGQRSRAGQPPAAIAAELRPAIAAIIDDLDRWLAPVVDAPDGRGAGTSRHGEQGG